VLAELSGDELLQRRVSAAAAGRGHDLPEWVTALGQSRPTGPGLQIAHVLGDGDNVLLGVGVPGGHEITLTIYIDHNLGTLVKDAFFVPGPTRALADQMMAVADNDPDTTVTELDPADARARVSRPSSSARSPSHRWSPTPGRPAAPWSSGPPPCSRRAGPATSDRSGTRQRSLS
jgi:hypothetical protein